MIRFDFPVRAVLRGENIGGSMMVLARFPTAGLEEVPSPEAPPGATAFAVRFAAFEALADVCDAGLPLDRVVLAGAGSSSISGRGSAIRFVIVTLRVFFVVGSLSLAVGRLGSSRFP